MYNVKRIKEDNEAGCVETSNQNYHPTALAEGPQPAHSNETDRADESAKQTADETYPIAGFTLS